LFAAQNALDIFPVFCDTPASIRRQARRRRPDRSRHIRLRFFDTILQRSSAMFQKSAKPLLITGLLIGLVCIGQSARAGNPFASNDQPNTRPGAAKKSPSVLDKVATGTKSFFNKTGEALHLKKPQPRKPPAIVAAKPRVAPPPYRERKSWFSWLKPQEQERQTSVHEWMGKTEQVKP
jgi:hypothetical protein